MLSNEFRNQDSFGRSFCLEYLILSKRDQGLGVKGDGLAAVSTNVDMEKLNKVKENIEVLREVM